jgi:hypothetical protein
MTTVDLRVEARAEVDRLSRARALVRDGDVSALPQLEADTAWLALARSTHLRRAMRGGTLQLWRIAFDNGDERAVESTIVALRIERGTSIDSADVLQRVEQASARWRDESTHVLAQFRATRLERERAIVLSRQRSVDAVQPGLFDRRADRVHAEQLAEHAAAREDDEARLRALERALGAAARPPQLLLALVTTR